MTLFASSPCEIVSAWIVAIEDVRAFRTQRNHPRRIAEIEAATLVAGLRGAILHLTSADRLSSATGACARWL
jgi:hypothetical protein